VHRVSRAGERPGPQRGSVTGRLPPATGMPGGFGAVSVSAVTDPSPVFRALATTRRPRERVVPAQRDLTLPWWEQRQRMFTAGVPVDRRHPPTSVPPAAST
jgi:hypothetical protein